MLFKKLLTASVLLLNLLSCVTQSESEFSNYDANLNILEDNHFSVKSYLNDIDNLKSLYIDEWPSTENLEKWIMFRDQINYYNSATFKLIGDLWRNYPEAAELEALMVERFQILPNLSYSSVFTDDGYENDLQLNIKWYIETFPNNIEGREQIHLGYYLMQVRANYHNDVQLMNILRDYENAETGKSESLKNILGRVAQFLNEGSDKQQLLSRIENEFPENSNEVDNRLHESAGNPFTFEFNDFLSDRLITNSDYLGKVLVIDFWATWCKPCVDEINYMKSLYERYRNGNVEFIGISLDTDSNTLETFLLKEDVTWPQYFDGLGWDNAVVTQYGLTAVPTVFIVDQNGLVVTIYGRGSIEEYLEELLVDGR